MPFLSDEARQTHFLEELKRLCSEYKVDLEKIGAITLSDYNGFPISIEPEDAHESFQVMIENMILRTNAKVSSDVHIAFREYMANYLRSDEMPTEFECSVQIWDLMSQESKDVFNQQIKFAHILLMQFEELNGDSFMGRNFETFRFYIQAIYQKNKSRLPVEL